MDSEPQKTDLPAPDGKTIELPLDDFVPLRRRKKKASSVRSRTVTFFTETLALFHDHVKDTEETIRDEQGEIVHHNVTQESDENGKFGDLAENYERAEEFAGGGQGVISRGRDLHLRRLVAIKSLRKEHLDDPGQRGAFIAEARITAQLEHPSILPIYSLHSDDQSGLHLAMKMVYGQDLKSYIKTIIRHYSRDGIKRFNERKSLRFRLEIFLRICDALSYAHSRNIMHCDLKPENIMIGEYHEAYLMDWGIARLIKEPDYDPATWTKPKRITGTPRFLTPEAIRGEHCDERADIYAMGLILYEITTLAEAYTGKTPEDILKNICTQNMRPVTHLFHHSIDSDLKAIILKAAAEDRDDRYRSVRELSDDLRKYMRNDEVSANPDSLIRKAIRWTMHHSKVTMIMLLLCVIAVIGNLAYNLAKQITDQQYAFEKKTAVGLAFHYCAEIAYKFDRELSKLENLLIATGHELEFFYDRKIPTAAIAGELPESRKLRHWSAPGSQHSANDPRIPATGLFAARFAKIVLGDTEKDDGAGSPVTAAGLTFADGLNFAYPDDPATVSADPRTTHGFRERIRKDMPASGWSVPFRKEYTKDSHTHLTGSVRIAADPGAVLYLDLDISRLMQSIRNAKSLQDFAEEMTFVDKNGRIILTGRNGVLNEPEKLDAVYPDPMLLERIRHYENGYFTFMREIDDSPREMVCVFSKCQTLGMFYLEIYDMETLLDNFESGRIKKH